MRKCASLERNDFQFEVNFVFHHVDISWNQSWTGTDLVRLYKLARAKRFYAAMGKRAMHIRKEIGGHVANRLQTALYRASESFP